MRQTETTRLHDDVERTEFSDLAKSARTERRTRTVPPSERVYVVPFGLISVGVSGFAGLVSSVTRDRITHLQPFTAQNGWARHCM